MSDAATSAISSDAAPSKNTPGSTPMSKIEQSRLQQKLLGQEIDLARSLRNTSLSPAQRESIALNAGRLVEAQNRVAQGQQPAYTIFPTDPDYKPTVSITPTTSAAIPSKDNTSYYVTNERGEKMGISISPSVVAQQNYMQQFKDNTFVNDKGQGFSTNPSTIQIGSRDITIGEIKTFGDKSTRFVPYTSSTGVSQIQVYGNRYTPQTVTTIPSNETFFQSVARKSKEQIIQSNLTESTLQRMDAKILPFFEKNIAKGQEKINEYYTGSQNIPEGKRTLYNQLTFLPKTGLYADIVGLQVGELGYLSLTRPKETSAAIAGGLIATGGYIASDINMLHSDYGTPVNTLGFLSSTWSGIKRNPGSLVVDFIAMDKALKIVQPVTIPIKNQFLIQKANFAEDFVPMSEIISGGGSYKGLFAVDDFSDFSKGTKVNSALKNLQGENVAYAHVTNNPFDFSTGSIVIQRSVPRTPEPIIKTFTTPFGNLVVENTGLSSAQLMQLGGVNTRRALMEEVNFYTAVQKSGPILSAEKNLNNVPVIDMFGKESTQSFKLVNVLQPGESQAYTRYAVGDESYGVKFSLLGNKPTIYYGVGTVGTAERLATEKATSDFLNRFGKGGLLYVSPENIFGVSREYQLVSLAEKTSLNLKSSAPDVSLFPDITKRNSLVLSGEDVGQGISKGFTDILKAREEIIIPENKYSLVSSRIDNPFTLRLSNNPSPFIKPVLKVGESIFESTMPKQRVVKVSLQESFFSPVEVEATIKDIVTGKEFKVSNKELYNIDNEGFANLLEQKSSGKELVRTNELSTSKSSLFNLDNKPSKVLDINTFQESVSSRSKTVSSGRLFPLSSLSSSNNLSISSSNILSSSFLSSSYKPSSSSSKVSSSKPSSSLSSSSYSSSSLLSSSKVSSSKPSSSSKSSSGSSIVSSSSGSSSSSILSSLSSISSSSSRSSRSSSSSSSSSIIATTEGEGGLFFPSSSESKKLKKIIKSKQPKFNTGYTPSVEATFFNIHGKKPSKREISTGLNIRPIIEDKKRNTKIRFRI